MGCLSISFGQDSTKVIKKTGQKRMTKTPGGAFPVVSFKKANPELAEANITGKFIIEEYSLQVKTSETNKAIRSVGSALEISETDISGAAIDTISYRISDSQNMNTEDYLFRIFGEVPESIPDNLPMNILVHKTDNLDCYGIAQLADGTVLIPYKGLLLYLRRY